MGEAFESIMRGLGEVKAHREGKHKLKTTTIEVAPLPVYEAKEIRAIRIALGFSQAVFAQVLGVVKKTVEAWEAGRNIPNGPACRFLEVLRKDHDVITRDRIVIYSTKPSGVRMASKSQNSTSRISLKKVTKARTHNVAGVK